MCSFIEEYAYWFAIKIVGKIMGERAPWDSKSCPILVDIPTGSKIVKRSVELCYLETVCLTVFEKKHVRQFKRTEAP